MHSRFCKIRTSLTRDANSWIYGSDLWPLEAVLASSSGCLEAVPGPSWGHSGRSWLILGPLRATLGRFGERADDGIADLAKFAKSKPIDAENKESMILAKNFVNNTKLKER